MESAHLRLERMLPELRDLEQRKIFTKAEISDIVKQRTAHELSLAKPRSPEPYLQYVAYERRLEKLRQLRVKKLGPRRGFSVSDHSIPRHILKLFQSACQRFPTSLPLWHAHISYALTFPSTRIVTRILSSAIAANPSHAGFWVTAARFEMDGDLRGTGGGDVEAARRLCMRGLRFVKGEGSIEIWKEWIRIELVFMEGLRHRNEALGLGQANGKGKGKATDDEDEVMDEIAADLPESGELPDAEGVSQIVDEVDTVTQTGPAALADGALLKVILPDCFKSVESVDIFDAVLSLLRSLPITIPARGALLNITYDSLASLHPRNPRAMRILATRSLYDCAPPSTPQTKNVQLGPSHAGAEKAVITVEGTQLVDELAKAVKALEVACRADGRGEVWGEYVAWLVETAESLESDHTDLARWLDAALAKALKAYLKGAPAQSASPRFVVTGLSRLLGSLDLGSDVDALIKRGLNVFPADESLWDLRIRRASESDLPKVVRQATEALPWAVGPAEAFVGRLAAEKDPEKAKDALTASLVAATQYSKPTPLRSGSDDDNSPSLDRPASASEVYLRALTTLSLRSPIPGHSSRIAFYKYLSVLTALPLRFLIWATSIEDAHDLGTLEYLHGLTISHRDADVDAWLAWLGFLLKTKGSAARAGSEFQKGKRALGTHKGDLLEEEWLRLLDEPFRAQAD